MSEKPTYTIIPNAALDALIKKSASVSDIIVYQVLCRHYNTETNRAWPSLNTIAKLSNCSQRNVQRSIAFLCASGMIYKTKNKNIDGDFDSNVYYLPHCIRFHIESLQADKSRLRKNQKLLKELLKLEVFVLQSINNSIYIDIPSLPRDTMSLPRDKKPGGRDKSVGEVETQSPTNNTTINTTINITNNVKKENENNGDLIKGLENINQFNLKKPSRLNNSPERVGNINSFLNIKKESLSQQMATELDDFKSLPFYRKIASVFEKNDQVIYKCLGLTKELEQGGEIRKNKAAAFTDLIKREAEKLGVHIC